MRPGKNMSRRIERTCVLLVCVLILSAVPAFSSSEGSTGGMIVVKRQKEMVIYCPETVKFQLQTPQGWNPVVLYSQALLKFEQSETDGKTLHCLYRVDNNQFKLTTMVTQSAPYGYKCQAGGNTRKFTCEKIGPQVRRKQYGTVLEHN